MKKEKFLKTAEKPTEQGKRALPQPSQKPTTSTSLKKATRKQETKTPTNHQKAGEPSEHTSGNRQEDEAKQTNQSESSKDIVIKLMEERLLSLERKMDSMTAALVASENGTELIIKESEAKIKNLQKSVEDQQKLLQNQQLLINQLQTTTNNLNQALEKCNRDLQEPQPPPSNQQPPHNSRRRLGSVRPAGNTNSSGNTTPNTISPHMRQSNPQQPTQRGTTTASGDLAPSKPKCFIAHGAEMDTFNRTLFSKSFDIETHKIASLRETKTESSNPSELQKAIRKHRPAAIVLHVGKEDILKKLKDNQSISEEVETLKSVIKGILKNTPSKICISLPIPAPKLPSLDASIKSWNLQISSFITELRKTPALTNRVFTINNARIGEHTTTQVAADSGIESVPTEHGGKKLWLNLREGLNRMTNPNHKRRRHNEE